MIEQSYLEKFREDARGIVKTMYKDEQGNPFILTDGQCDIFNLIFKKITPRVHIESFTRYGKSATVAMAILTRVCTYPERWCIAAGNDDQAHIIISHLISHIFDNELTKRRFVMGKGENEESIRRYRNKDKLNFKLEGGLLGEVFVTNAKGAMGFGAGNVVIDEAALVSDKDESLVFRMLGDQIENFYFKIGNPWDSGHFRQTAEDVSYFKVKIDYWQGVREGRVTPVMIDEARKKPYFDVLYECKFPLQGKQDEEGWIPLLARDEVERAFVYQWNGFGVSKLGGDVAGGGVNSSVVIHRTTNMARIVLKNNDPDTMNYAEKIINLSILLKVDKKHIGIDRVGVGKGVSDILARQWDYWQGTNVGDKFEVGNPEGDMFLNLRAKVFWKLRDWIIGGGKLLVESDVDKENWLQLAQIKYRHKLEGTKGKLQIMPKERMLKEGVQSPDVADALSLTFVSEDTDSTGELASQLARLAEVQEKDMDVYR